MLATRSLLVLALCTSLAGVALAEEVRKGTRNYRPDGSAAAITETPAAASTVSRDEKLQQCMDTWDKGTHITKPKWREICIRQLDAR